MTTPRIPPLEPPFAPEVAEEMARWMPPGSPIPPIALFRTLGRNLALSRAMWGLGSHLLSKRLGVGVRERELVILRVCARSGCESEWGVHAAAFGGAAGLTPEEIAATARRDPGEGWSAQDRALLALADALCEANVVSDALWRRLRARYEEETLLALLALAGWYRLISGLARSAAVEPEPWAARFPAEA